MRDAERANRVLVQARCVTLVAELECTDANSLALAASRRLKHFPSRVRKLWFDLAVVHHGLHLRVSREPLARC